MLRQFKHLAQFYPKHKRIIDASDHRMPHLTYGKDSAEKLKVQHFKPQKFADWSALMTVRVIKGMVNLTTRYGISPMTQKRWLTKTLLLETLQVVPGMVVSMCRHMRSIRLFKKDNGWIQQLLEEADNQRFHYFTILSMRKPGFFARIALGMMQMIFSFQVLFGYTLSARHAHKFLDICKRKLSSIILNLLRRLTEKEVLFLIGNMLLPVKRLLIITNLTKMQLQEICFQ